MDRSYQHPNGASGYGAPNGQGANYGYQQNYNNQYGQSQYDSSAPQIRNPFAPPIATYSEQNASFDPDGEQQAAAWSAAYAPQLEQPEKAKKGRNDRPENANFAPLGHRPAGAVAAVPVPEPADAAASEEKKNNFTVRRKGGGETWEDKTLLEWDPTQFRIMVGNLAGEVTDDSLAKAFAPYGVSKARVVREKRTTKSKGYGFVSFTDGEQGFKAAREMVGKYIGSHPVTIQRSKTNLVAVPIKDKNKNNKYNHKNNNHNNHNNKGKGKAQNESTSAASHDPLRAKTGAGIEKKPAAKSHLKLLG
ncbi:uncharacterized protein K489DRAFT_382675 [Dissoconium aciculare CBS 342.82]|uniref:RRM domain-containing protein n=1 Tax=Dissoconium aciculare CBS 342.82 TaxID=1314786 RepID=A0A6J3LY93_9PEZI|nr:uncharacterized protein K489DRAFT_382675 [Dissoconium aciculare CBS 342.82]KAF1820736.1 hypothetical protein K489DRAFT_382675 [Dissoconium aciculare CBS 342.82]